MNEYPYDNAEQSQEHNSFLQSDNTDQFPEEIQEKRNHWSHCPLREYYLIKFSQHVQCFISSQEPSEQPSYKHKMKEQTAF